MLRYLIQDGVDLTQAQLQLLLEIELATITLRRLCQQFRALGKPR